MFFRLMGLNEPLDVPNKKEGNAKTPSRKGAKKFEKMAAKNTKS